MAEEETSPTPAPTNTAKTALWPLLGVGFLTLIVTVLGTLQFRSIGVTTNLKSRLDAHQERLTALSETVAGRTAAAEEQIPDVEAAAPEPELAGRPTIRVLDRLKILAEERQLVMDEIKELRGNVAALDARMQELAKRVQGIERGPAPEQPADVSSRAPAAPRFTLAHTLPGRFALAFSPNGARLATSSDDNTIKIWDLASRTVVHTLAGHVNSVSDIAFSPDGRWLASGSLDRTVKLWHPATGAQVRTFDGHKRGVGEVLFSPRGDTLASVGFGAGLDFWDPERGIRRAELAHDPKHTSAVAFAPDGLMLAAGDTNGEIQLFDTAAATPVAILTGHTGAVHRLRFSPAGRLLASGGADHTVRLWPVTGDRKELRRFDLGGQALHDLVFSPDGEFLAASAADGSVAIWVAATGELVQTLQEGNAAVTAVAFSPDGRWLASTGLDGLVRLWGAL